jgi:hypothetical protein
MTRTKTLGYLLLSTTCFLLTTNSGLANKIREHESQQSELYSVGRDYQPNGKGGKVELPNTNQKRFRTTTTVSNNGITYYNGPVMTGATNVYYIWYGNWTNNSATTILTDLMRGFTGSPLFNTNTTYYNGSGQRVLNSINFVQSINDNYSLGTSLSDANILSIVTNAITNGALPKDPNGVYFILTSADVIGTSGFGTNYCGWHNHAPIMNTDIKYSFVGDASTQAPSSCIALTPSLAPNGNLGADGMASVIFHELAETVTDPDLNAWFDSRGAENADKCAWNFGTTYTTATSKKANVRLGGRDFLIQQNWVNANGGYCSLSY